MPVLHTYRSKEGHYVLAGVNGRIVTYRLGPEGFRRLQENDINDNDKFSWQILLELIRQGEAFTSSPAADDEDLSGWTQMGLLFNIEDNEPSATESVPLCACGSMDELHIVELADSKVASMLCHECRLLRRREFDASIPIYMINTLSALERLLERSGLKPDDSVTAYKGLLNSTLSAKWGSKVRPKVAVVQAGLFAEPEKEQGSLL